MKFKKVCIISVACLLLLTSVAIISPNNIAIGEIVNHPWMAFKVMFQG